MPESIVGYLRQNRFERFLKILFNIFFIDQAMIADIIFRMGYKMRHILVGD